MPSNVDREALVVAKIQSWVESDNCYIKAGTIGQQWKYSVQFW